MGSTVPDCFTTCASILTNLSIDISSAHIATFGEKAVDVFYVTDSTGKKITREATQKKLRDKLLEAFERRRAGCRRLRRVNPSARPSAAGTEFLIPVNAGTRLVRSVRGKFTNGAAK